MTTSRRSLALLIPILCLAGCDTRTGGGQSVSDSVEPGEVRVTGAVLDADGGETALDVVEEGSLWFCGESCFSLQVAFDYGGTRLFTAWSFDPGEPPVEGSSAVTYSNIRWENEEQFGRQGEHRNVSGSWGDAPGGEIVIESTCTDCVDGVGGASGYLDGPSVVTLYDGETEAPNGGEFILDELVFRELPLVY